MSEQDELPKRFVAYRGAQMIEGSTPCPSPFSPRLVSRPQTVPPSPYRGLNSRNMSTTPFAFLSRTFVRGGLQRAPSPGRDTAREALHINRATWRQTHARQSLIY
jgi:hypothetical protein